MHEADVPNGQDKEVWFVQLSYLLRMACATRLPKLYHCLKLWIFRSALPAPNEPSASDKPTSGEPNHPDWQRAFRCSAGRGKRRWGGISMLDGTQRRILRNDVTDHHTGLSCARIAGLNDLARHLDKTLAFLVHSIGAIQFECQFARQHGDNEDSRMSMDRRGGPRRKVQHLLHRAERLGHGLDIGLELVAGDWPRQRRRILWLGARERCLPRQQVGRHHAQARGACVTGLNQVARQLHKALTGFVDLLDAVYNECVLALQHRDEYLAGVPMERRRRAGIKVQDALGDVKPSGLRQAGRAKQVSHDWAGRRLTKGKARPDREEELGDQGYRNSLSVHVLILLGFHLVMPG
jgi:hypothetical protein